MTGINSTQRNLYSELIRSALENPECPGINDNEKRIAFILKIVDSDDRSKFMNSIIANKKSSEKSVKFGNKGDYYFNSSTNASLDKAVEEFTKSVAYAPNGSRELALAYANRSVVLFEGSLISDCLLDIDRAIKNNYPEKLRAKLYLLKATCLEITDPDDYSAIQKAQAETQEWSKKMDRKNQEYIRKILDDKEPVDMSIFSKWDSKKLLPKLQRENPIIPGVSSAIELQYSEKWGRHMVAARDIKPGEVLSVEKAYAKLISQNARYKFCWNCGQQTWASVSCESCVEVVFCSETCRTNGKDEHHNIECSIISSVMASGISYLSILSLRIFVKALKEVGNSLETLQSNLKKIDDEKNPLMKGFINGVLEPGKFSSIYSLKMDTEEKTDSRVDDLCNAILISYLLATKTDIFGSKKKAGFSAIASEKKIIFTVGLLERIGAIVRINTFGQDFANSKDGKEISFGVVAPALSFFNHSCNPALTRTNHGSYIASTSHRPIKKGEQIFGSYVLSYKFLAKNERQMELRRNYQFTCQCEACENEWLPQKKLEELNLNSGRNKSASSELIEEIRRVGAKCRKAKDHLDSFGRLHDQIYDVSKDIADITKIIEKSYQLGFERNSTETSLAEQTLINLLDLTDDRYLSLNYFTMS